MRRLSYFITISTDGMYADTDGGLGGFEPDEEGHRYANRLLETAGDAVMGRRMYDVMDYWDDLDLDDPAVSEVEKEFATFWRETPKHVASRGQPRLRLNATKIDGDVVEVVRRMKEGDGPDIMLGAGADLFAELTEADLIDDYRFMIAPMALGRGKALFAFLKEPLRLRLTGTRTFPSGGVLHEYVRADREATT
ncbi:MAG TPA: dihydrofolate reductase family protein [Candidatus Limnocylindrales bacterium]|jgi:dihydrofolate reductase|nr:dihydrofolate reductase family protein [Candidatus Limnocylindrales bacterium]